MWNNGHFSVYIKNKLILTIFVDSQEKSPYDLIEELKEKYKIKKVIKHEHDWR